jgi:hypothetical protein
MSAQAESAPNAAPSASFLAGWRGSAVALLICLAALGVRFWTLYDPHVRYDKFQLPAFDAHVYVAMAERPAFFSVAPWGYRVLAPLLAGAFPGMGPVRGFYALTWLSLLGTGVLLHALLRRLGNSDWAALLGVLLFALSGPVSQALSYPFVAEPLCVLLLVAFLLAFESGASLAILALLAVLGALAKEVLLALLPLLFVAARAESRSARAWLRAALAALPALVATGALRLWWAPQHGGDPTPSAATLTHALGLIASSWPQWWEPALVSGLLPLALFGALRRVARPFVLRYGYLGLAFGALPFAAGVYVGTAEQPADFFSGDVPRLTIYLVPLLIPLALILLDRLRPLRVAAPARPSFPSWLKRGAAAASLGLAVLPFFFLDSYRRVDLSGQRDGLVVLATLRESLRAAERLERDRPLVFTPETHRWVPGKSKAPLMAQMRWFLREGFGPQPQYGSRDIVLRSPEGRILIPSLAARPLDITVTLQASVPETVTAALNGRVLGAAAVGREPTRLALVAPREAVFRGDNILTLRRGDSARGGPRLLALEASAR